MQKKDFQDLVSTFNVQALASTSDYTRMDHLSLRYAILTRHKAAGASDDEKSALAQTMLDTTIKFIENAIDFIQKPAFPGTAAMADVNSWVEPPLTAITAPESIAYLPKDTAERLSDLALKAVDTLAEKPKGYDFHSDAHKNMGHVVQTILTHADMIADRAKAHEITADHLKTQQPIVPRKPILLKPRATTLAA